MAATACARRREDAVLSANYILASLKDVMSAPFGDGPCMHEALFDDSFLEGTGVTTLDFAKAMIDEGYHPMTMYFPLVVHGAMLIEPTESESKESLDRFIHVLRDLAIEARPGTGRASTARRISRRAAAWTKPRRAQAGAALEAEGFGRGGGVTALTRHGRGAEVTQIVMAGPDPATHYRRVCGCK